MNPSRQDATRRGTRNIILVGFIAMAMGIGRFAFTPLMPLMLRDGTLSPAVGAEWAAARCWCRRWQACSLRVN